jgi:hypothetical protein
MLRGAQTGCMRGEPRTRAHLDEVHRVRNCPGEHRSAAARDEAFPRLGVAHFDGRDARLRLRHVGEEAELVMFEADTLCFATKRARAQACAFRLSCGMW